MPSLGAGLTLYFCRHGETVGNLEGIVQGVSVDTPLTPRGVEQARTVADLLAHDAPGIRDYAFVCSPIGRARATNEIVRESLGLPRDGYTVDARLKEMNHGIWEGLKRADVRAADPAGYAARERDKWNVPIRDGESYCDVATRAQSWIADLTGNTFSVSHGLFTKVLRGLFAGLDWRGISALDEPQGVVFRVRGNVVERLEAA